MSGPMGRTPYSMNMAKDPPKQVTKAHGVAATMIVGGSAKCAPTTRTMEQNSWQQVFPAATSNEIATTAGTSTAAEQSVAKKKRIQDASGSRGSRAIIECHGENRPCMPIAEIGRAHV